MARPLQNRDIEFRGTPGGALERVVRLPDGKEYAHRCSRKVFEAVVAHVDDHQREGVKMKSIADAIDAPITQVNVALQLLTERGLIETHGRLGYVAPGYDAGFNEHAMTEFCALIDGCPPELVDSDSKET